MNNLFHLCACELMFIVTGISSFQHKYLLTSSAIQLRCIRQALLFLVSIDRYVTDRYPRQYSMEFHRS